MPTPRVQGEAYPLAPTTHASHFIVESESIGAAQSPRPITPLTQDKSLMGPAANTRSKTWHTTITQECMWAAWENTVLQPRQLTNQKFPLQVLCEFAGAIIDCEIGQLLKYRHIVESLKYKQAWKPSFDNEIGRLAQVMPQRMSGTNTIFFIHKDQIPKHHMSNTTYRQISCNYQKGKAEPKHVRLAIGGNRINYPGDHGTPTADLLTIKIMLNSIISTTGANFMTMGVKTFYLNTPLK